ncbi:MAG: hypothetical protein M0C28_11705 [Candidatus Moduliflexus flocculans]|nr:hypothetical protein [Candidatus Moduliflexus flocculans]
MPIHPRDSWSLLPAAPGEPLDRDDRAGKRRRPLSRLERAHRGGVLPAQRRAPASSTPRDASRTSSTTTRR